MNVDRKKAQKKGKNISQKIREKLLQTSLLQKDYEGIPTDLGEIYEICDVYQQMVEDLLKAPDGREMLGDRLVDIEVELFHHLLYHLKSLRYPLNKLTNVLLKKDEESDE